ncbi:MAG: hypothetical protein SGBAC_005929 [Bacillariaceae sp.]
MTGGSNNKNTSIKQVKLTVEDLGSVIKGSKKRVSWTFSIGQEEHTVVFLWSKKSGKRQVIEGNDRIYEETKKGNFFFHKWVASSFSSCDDDDNVATNLHILASSHTPAKGKVCDSFCKFELIVNGQPFSKMPHQDGTPLPKEEGPGPYGIFDIVYPQGYDEHFTKEAPFHDKGHLNSIVVKRMDNSQSSIDTEPSNMEEESAPAESATVSLQQ